MKFLFAIAPTILLVVYGQLITKWRVATISDHFEPTTSLSGKIVAYVTDPYILSAYITVFIGSFTWMFVLERYSLSQAFPAYIGLTFGLVVLGSIYLLDERVSVLRIIGMGLILLGVFIVSRF